MGKPLDSDEVVAMLRKEAAEWAVASDAAAFDTTRKQCNYTSLAYAAAADQVQQMANEQADDSVSAAE
jgi:hypothetical protein